jgi:hypothetical protein
LVPTSNSISVKPPEQLWAGQCSVTELFGFSGVR